MTRPAEPAFAVITWDTGNYSAGAFTWSGTPKRVVPPGTTFITPTDGATAQNANYLWGACFDELQASQSAIQGALDMAGQMPILNWRTKVAVDATFALKRADYSTKDQTWFAVGDGGSDWLMASQDYGQTWTKPTLGALIPLIDVVCDAAGNVSVIASGSRTVYFGTRTAYGTVTFASTANALTVAPSGGGHTYDVTHTKYIACYRNASSGMKVDTSTNGTTFTAQTIPATWTGYTGTANNPQVHAKNGVAIACFYDDVATLFRIIRSTDGGTTWNSVANLTTGMSSAISSYVRPTYDSVNNIWYIATVSQIAGTRQSQIYKSIDGGTTWTSSALFAVANDLVVMGLVSLGALLCVLNDDGRFAWSIDGGVTFQWGGRNITSGAMSAGNQSLRAGGGGLLFLYSTDKAAWSSTRFGNVGQAV